VAVAVVDAATGLRSVFDLGAHFVLYKPVSTERAKSSFRAARALMKRERRRNFRIAVQIPVIIRKVSSDATLRVTTTDLSEGGMAVRIPGRQRPSGLWKVAFTLPGTPTSFELSSEFAWEGNMAQAGLRFVDVAPDASRQLCDWLKRNSPETEQDDPPVRCQLTDLSLGACYLDITSPFPVSTRVTLSMRAGSAEMRAEGVVRVMHPEKGMGVEFSQTTPEHRQAVEKFLSLLTQNRDVLPELMVEPEGLESDDEPSNLFRKQSKVPSDSFHEELKKQRGIAASAGSV
jgi:c-di-GMP-binding flagellar brake protein YcgR